MPQPASTVEVYLAAILAELRQLRRAAQPPRRARVRKVDTDGGQ